MTRKRVPIQLKGSDEQYFRTREILERPAPPPAEAKPVPEARPEPAARSRTAGQGTRSPATVSQDDAEPAGGEVVSRIVPLGRALSRRVQALAEETGVPVDDLLYAARKKAVARVRQTIAGRAKPAMAKVEKGGETIRISFKLTPEELGRLKAWFDPLDLGLATKAVAPLLAAALRAEVEAICGGVS